ncbi:MAG: SpoVA/SpoVAEb family sporulation membrane protein [Firmicutes bacterium]|nr:SpoVA/SpoVAEb family sporulation membrane protein [Bacillota bacterium]
MNKQKNQEYLDFIKEREPTTSLFPSILWAFLIGGAICVGAEALGMWALHLWPTLTPKDIGAIEASALIFLASLLTGIGVFDKLGKVAGAGTFVPITGFSNATTASAMDGKSEGIVFGVCAKMFAIAGPVIVIGTVVSTLIGFVYLIFRL